MKLKRPIDNGPPQDFLTYTNLFPGPKIFCVIPKTKSGGVLHKLAEPEEAWEWIERFQDMGYSAYMTVNISSSDRRIKSDIITARAIWVEDDTPRQTPREFPLHPSIVIRSSSTKWHYYWLTETTNLKQWESVQLRMVQAYGSDPGAKDLSRVLRLPGTANHKYDPPEDCVIYECLGTKYDWEDLVETFPPIIGAKGRTNITTTKYSSINVAEHIEMFRSGESIAPSMNSLIMHYAWHYSGDKIKHMIEDMFDTVPAETMEEHSKRYHEARIQIDKFVRTACDKVIEVRGTEIDAPTVSFREIQPLTNSYLKSPTIPKECIPDALYNAAKATGEYLSLGPEPAILSGLCTVSALLGKNVLIKHIADSPYETYCTAGMIVVMETGTRKSEICKIMSKPMRDFEKNLQKEWKSVQNANLAEAKLYDTLIRKKEQFLSKQELDPAEIPIHARELGNLMDLRDSIQVVKPTLIVEDITEEELIKRMYDNNGCMCIMDEDARNVIKNIIGRYSSNSSGEGIWIRGLHSTPDTSLKYHRAKDGGTEVTIHGPCLNALLFVQQDLALELKKHEVYRTSGLAARLMMYFYPVDTVKLVKASDRTRLIDEVPMSIYYKVLMQLSKRREEPLRILMSEAAQERFNKYNQRYGDIIQQDYSRHDYMNKMVTQAVHYAVCLAAIDDPQFMEAYKNGGEYTLKGVHANMGCILGEAIAVQLLDTHELLENLSIVKKAQDFIRSLIKKYRSGLYLDGFVCNSYLYQAFSQLNKDNYIPIINMLTEKGWLGCSVSSKTRILNSGLSSRSARANETVYHLNIEGIRRVEAEEDRFMSLGIGDIELSTNRLNKEVLK